MRELMKSFASRCGELSRKGALAVPEHETKALLAAHGVPVPRGLLCADRDGAAAAAKSLRYPLVLKLASDSVLHKTELGGVRTGIGSEGELLESFDEMHERFLKQGVPGYLGILIEEQAEEGTEIIAGLQNDPVFGPLLMLGLGGVFTDVFEDVAFGALPVARDDIRAMLDGLKGASLLRGYRGSPAVNMDALIEAVESIAALGLEAAPLYGSVDFNPIIAGPSGVVAVDAKMVLPKEGESGLRSEMPRTEGMSAFFTPASVAVMGASSTPGKIGNVILDSLVNYEYAGRVYPVNPHYEELMGLKSYPDLSSLPEPPELVVIVVDLARTPELLDEMSRLGCRNALIVSGGGKELGGERAKLEGEIASRARALGIRLVGPNCIGSFDGKSRFDSFFHSHERLSRPPAGPMSFITQSGTWGCVFLEEAYITGVSRMVSYGNRVDVDEGDLVAYLAGDRETSVIGSYIEGLGDGRKFLEASRRAIEAGKPVVVFKTGRTRQSAQASVSHTGAYGGSYRVYEGVMRQHGVVLADSFHELYASCEALALQPPARGNRAAMLSNGAGPMVNALDHFPGKGLELVRLGRNSVKAMRDHFSFFYLVENPVDVTGSATAADYEYVVKTLMDDDAVDIIMPFFVFQDTPLDESIVERLAALGGFRAKPIVCCAAGGDYTLRMSDALRRRGIPVYPDVARWVAAASALAQWGKTLAANRA
ncbi:MAG TPA: acetate--CoA ligase family protein [Spirochaetota bacterium]|nr:acetate--CoA ligase family protein [Spirochaetota bacterium]